MKKTSGFDNIANMDDLNKNSKMFGGSSGAHSTSDTGLSRGMRVLICVVVILAVLMGCYFTAVYSNIPFIARLRTLYIETAMSTLSHQWLATAFIPRSVIDGVMDDIDRQLEDNMLSESTLPPGQSSNSGSSPSVPPSVTDAEDPKRAADLAALLEMFPQIDAATIPGDLELENIQVKDIESLGIMTTAGDPVWAIDMPNEILIMTIDGTDGGFSYNGKLALCKDSSRTILGVSKYESRGQTVVEYCKRYDAPISINASAFYDPDGKGRGEKVVGLVLSDGEMISDVIGSPYQIAGFDYEDNLRVGYKVDTAMLRCGIQFYPILIANGEKKVGEGSYGMGIQPRSCIGQTSTKDTLLLVIDGRQVHSAGTTVSVCADVLLRYDCYTAMHNDGGSSALMCYLGETITKTSSPNPTGRYLPDAWVVLKPGEIE